ncbi:alpha/beta hydrolase [Kovacikia minuta CCNUW1]|uniref:alpha/beta fold hydrolase n=1 Tax=Kovacikia minuta TaxID=2931930 RepID=UPI001CC9A940|nr:alpha/beta hydrolase [Kovacikia minuta]UBF26136.1 alpha/beta hydrolase [Kovacikia minuta CCNUW1]
MLQFHPPGIGQQVVETSLGAMVYYTPVGAPWTPAPADAPTLLFLHGFGGGASAYEWSKVYPAFLDTHRVLVPDLIGWGQSAHPARDYRVEDYLTTLTEFVEKTCTTPVTVVASSLTGAIAVRLAVGRSDLFNALFLVCPSGFSDFGQDAGRRLPLQIINTPLLNQLIYTLGATHEAAVRNFLERFLFAQPDRISPETVAAYLESAQQPNAQYAALAFLQGNLYFDLARYIGQLKTPTTILWGEKAQFTPVEQGRRLACLNPTAVQFFLRLQGTGVLPALEQPETVTGLLQWFLWKGLNSGDRDTPEDATSVTPAAISTGN